jgi:hypothetical protein
MRTQGVQRPVSSSVAEEERAQAETFEIEPDRNDVLAESSVFRRPVPRAFPAAALSSFSAPRKTVFSARRAEGAAMPRLVSGHAHQRCSLRNDG